MITDELRRSLVCVLEYHGKISWRSSGEEIKLASTDEHGRRVRDS